MNELDQEKQKGKKLDILIFNLQHFTEYIEDIEMGMQLTRLGIFNPKLLKHDYLLHVNSEKLLNTKTSTWFKSDTNEILIISHIPREIIKSPVFEIIPYPDENNNILTEIAHEKYFTQDKKVYSRETKKLINNKCLTGILNQITSECSYTKILQNFQINYIEPNIILTWNLPKTILNHNCINNEITIEGNNIIKIFNCSLQINEISISNNMLDYTSKHLRRQ
uniref:Envelope protein n=1 Tax=Drosophila virilis TaxID=7244 RepID=O76328_DROVI|nr:envelope protein [Drosophila virilis]